MATTTTGEDKRKHLEFIQNIINRMARNSFMLKSLMALQVAALVAFQAKDGNGDASSGTASEPALWLVVFAVIPFWYLDSYFLSQERLFRRLYECVRKKSEGEIDFSMNTCGLSKGSLREIFYSFLSKALWPYYVIILLTLVVLKYLFD